MTRRYPIGAEVVPGGVTFRVWAPRRRAVAVVSNGKRTPLNAEAGGYFSGLIEGAADGYRYQFQLDDDSYLYPDPASRFQPDGPHGPSQVVDPARFIWADQAWRGSPPVGQVIYELHVGTFTKGGTWAAAEERLPDLKDLGITLIEVMPVAEFPGQFGWGYDGVAQFAPTRLYGTPNDFRRFVNTAHAAGIGVILDVVYNHLGPSGNYLAQFSESYFTKKYENEWGDAINFDGEGAAPVRELLITNAAFWIDEYHLDGLRLDATQSIHDSSPVHIITAVGQAARHAARGKPIFIVAENEPQNTALVRPVEQGGMGLDALWNDDFHHTAKVALTGFREAYYTDYHGSPQELISALKWGYLYQGQRYSWQDGRRGAPGLDVPARSYVTYLQNHDQVANSAWGLRMHAQASPGMCRALTALMLLGSPTPMLFQGQEFASSAPFLYFADHEPDLAKKVADGRKEFLRQFPSIAPADLQNRLAEPHAPETFTRCKLDHDERNRGAHAHALALHRDLLRLRREDPVLSQQDAGQMHGAVLAPDAFLLRWIDETDGDRLLVVNLGRELTLNEMPEPLLAPPRDSRWGVLWSSLRPEYGAHASGELDGEQAWRLPAQSAILLHPVEKPPQVEQH